MDKKIFWLHEKALSGVLSNKLHDDYKLLFIWDEQYFQNRNYSLKRLVFIYETLCDLSVEIIKGDTLEVMNGLAPVEIATFFPVDTEIKKITDKLSKKHQVEIINPQPFVCVDDKLEFKRFFKYWNKAQKTAFLENGGQHA